MITVIITETVCITFMVSYERAFMITDDITAGLSLHIYRKDCAEAAA